MSGARHPEFPRDRRPIRGQRLLDQTNSGLPQKPFHALGNSVADRYSTGDQDVAQRILERYNEVRHRDDPLTYGNKWHCTGSPQQASE